MSSMQSELLRKLNSKGANPNTKELDFYLFPKTKIREEDGMIAKTDLTMRLRNFIRSYYHQEAKDEQIINAVKSFVKKFNDLSTLEIDYVFTQIVNGEYPEIKKYSFNLSDITYALIRYEQKKKNLNSAYWQIKTEEKQNEETKKEAFNFLQAALKKNEAGERLTVYEKSTIGKHIAQEYDSTITEDAKRQAVNELPQRLKELNAIRKMKGDSKLIPIPDMYDAPMVWSTDLLYGYLLYNLKYHE